MTSNLNSPRPLTLTEVLQVSGGSSRPHETMTLGFTKIKISPAISNNLKQMAVAMH